MFHRPVRGIAGNISELPLALMAFVFCLVFPAINLVALAADSSVILLFSQQCAGRAAAAGNFADSLTALEDEATKLNGSAFAKFAHLQAVGGFKSTGSDLYIEATDYYSNKQQSFAANQPLPSSVDRTRNIFEYRVQSTYRVNPFLSLSMIPWISNVPGLGKSVVLTFNTRRAVEHPEGLAADQILGNLRFTGSALNLGVSVQTPGTLADDEVGTGWNYPKIYEYIQQAGQTVVSDDVFKVFANNGNWTDTKLVIAPGDKVWIDFRADGQWTNFSSNASFRDTFFDGDGQPDKTNSLGFPVSSMIGKTSTSAPFLLGKRQWNFPPPGTGTLFLAMNDDVSGPTMQPAAPPPGYAFNQGVQLVRVIVAR